MEQLKTCTLCKEPKDVSEFYNRSGRCKPCAKAKAAEWQKTHREQRAAICKTYALSHEKQELARRSQYKRLNKEKIKQSSRAYRSDNREHRREYLAEWRKQHPDMTLAAAHRRRDRLSGAGSFTAAEWSALKNKYAHRCLCCKVKEPQVVLTPDHVIPLCENGSNAISNIQPLCGRCNSSKGTRTIDYRVDNTIQVAA